MNLRINHFLSIACLMVGMNTFGQVTQTKGEKEKNDSIKFVYYTEAAVRSPVLRQVVVSTEITGNSNIKGDLYGNKFFEGKVASSKTSALVTFPLAVWGKNSITGSLLFEHNEFMLSNVDVLQGEHQDQLNNPTLSRNSVGFNAGYQRIDSLFGRNVIYAANVNGLTGKSGTIQRLNFLGTILLNLKQTATTNLSAGLVLNIDRSINIPVFPVITYWHKFSNNIELNVNLPQQAYLRKDFSTKLSGSIGTAINVSNTFFEYADQSVIPHNSNYTVLTLQNGIGIEYRFAKKIIVSLNGGIQTPLSARAFEVGENSENYFVKNKIGASPYVKLSVSLLPILKSVF